MNIPTFGFGAKPIAVNWGGKQLIMFYTSSSGIDGDPAPIVTVKELRSGDDKILITDVVKQGKGPHWAVFQDSLQKRFFGNHQPASLSNEMDVLTGQVKTLRHDKTTDPFQFSINVPHATYPTHSYRLDLTLNTYRSETSTDTISSVTHKFEGGGAFEFPGTVPLQILVTMDYKTGELTAEWENTTWAVDRAIGP